MILRGSEPCALQRDYLARVRRDRHPDEIFISNDACRWIEIDPARTGHVDLDPGMGVAADSTIVVVIRQMQIAGHEPGGNSARAKRRYHEHGEVATTAAPELERPGWSLDSLLVPRNVLEVPPDGPRHVA